MPVNLRTLVQGRWPWILLGLFVLRLLHIFGTPFTGPDEHQMYLIGLRSATSGVPAFFGPDVVYSATGIPGSLVGYLIAVPLALTHLPEAPLLFLNVLSFLVLILWSIQMTRSIKGLSWPLCLGWILFSPWSLEYSAHMLNPDYAFVGSVLFFMGFWELHPRYTTNWLPRRLSAFLLGAVILWVFQFHLSFFLLIPFAAWAAWENRRAADRGSLLIYFFLGACLLALPLLPTLLEFGPGVLFHTLTSNIHHSNLLEILGNLSRIFFRFLSFSTFEWPFFLGSPSTRVSLVERYPWSIPGLAVGTVLSLGQLYLMIRALWKKPPAQGSMGMTRKVVLVIVLGLFGLFAFSVKGPSSWTFWILGPWSYRFFFETYVEWQKTTRFSKKFRRNLVLAMGFSVLSFSLLLSVYRYPRYTLFQRRDAVIEALEKKDYGILDCRRDDQASWKGPRSPRTFVSPRCQNLH